MEIIALRPRLVVPDPDDSIAFYQAAFGATLAERYLDAGIVVHAGLSIGDVAWSISAEVREWGWLAPATVGGTPVLMTLDVDDARAVADRMVDSGATVVVPVADRPYGRCEGRIQDPDGHLWIPSHEIASGTDTSGEGEGEGEHHG